MLGCSFPYGYGLSEEESFHSVLSEYIKRPVYNLALIGGSLREALYILRNKELKNKLLNNNHHAKYFIFTYIPSQRKRLYSNYRLEAPFFYEKNGRLKYIYGQNNLRNRSFLYYSFMNYYSDHFLDNEKTFNLIKLYINEISRSIQNNFDNYNEASKLIILVYGDINNYDWEKVENENISVIKLSDIIPDENISDNKYKIWDKQHPNAKAWQIVVPALAKELNL